MNLDPYFETAPPWLRGRTIFLCKAGSHSYGLNTPESDLDLKGVCMEPIEAVVGFAERFEQFQRHDPEADVTIFGLLKFAKLAIQCNPNIIEGLFVRPEDVLLSTPIYEELRAYRKMFISEKARHTFRGYAMSQLKKIQRKHEYGTTGKRQHVIDKFGYDTKHAMHLVRLMRMGGEILRTGEVNVWRKDREDLLAVRRGEWSLDELVAWAEAEDKVLADLSTELPWGPPIKEVDALCRSLLLKSWGLA